MSHRAHVLRNVEWLRVPADQPRLERCHACAGEPELLDAVERADGGHGGGLHHAEQPGADGGGAGRQARGAGHLRAALHHTQHRRPHGWRLRPREAAACARHPQVCAEHSKALTFSFWALAARTHVNVRRNLVCLVLLWLSTLPKGLSCNDGVMSGVGVHFVLGLCRTIFAVVASLMTCVAALLSAFTSLRWLLACAMMLGFVFGWHWSLMPVSP